MIQVNVSEVQSDQLIIQTTPIDFFPEKIICNGRTYEFKERPTLYKLQKMVPPGKIMQQQSVEKLKKEGQTQQQVLQKQIPTLKQKDVGCSLKQSCSYDSVFPSKQKQLILQTKQTSKNEIEAMVFPETSPKTTTKIKPRTTTPTTTTTTTTTATTKHKVPLHTAMKKMGIPGRTLSDGLLHLRSCPKKRLLFAMSGLPGRGKTFLAHKLGRYLNWLSYKTEVFNIGVYRRKLYGTNVKSNFFDPSNTKCMNQRKKCIQSVMFDISSFFLDQDGHVAIYDAGNTTESLRQGVRDFVTKLADTCMITLSLVWIEIQSTQSVIEENLIALNCKTNPDFQSSGMTFEESSRDLRERINFYEKEYEPMGEINEAETYISIRNNASQIFTNQIKGYLLGKVVFFVGTMKLLKHDIFLSRHGESQYNVRGLLGGDSGLSPRGKKYANALGKFIINRPEVEGKKLHVWCSTLIRTIETSEHIGIPATKWHNLSEIDAGICDGLTYEEVKERYPDVARERNADKLRYRYPQGESYEDIIRRLEHVIFELNRLDGPVLVVAHRAVLRCLYAYYQEIPSEEIPYVSVPLHTVIKLAPVAYGCDETRYPLGIASVDDATSDEIYKPLNQIIGSSKPIESSSENLSLPTKMPKENKKNSKNNT